MLTTWVNGGGRLIAMHPDKQLAGLLGLTASTFNAVKRLLAGADLDRSRESELSVRASNSMGQPICTR